MASPLLEIRNLRVEFGSSAGLPPFPAVDGVDLDVEAGALLGIVGESGSGKSVAMLATMGLVDAPGRVHADALRFDGQDLLALPPAARRRVIGKDIAMVFQDASNSLNPSLTVGTQLREVLSTHLGLRSAALDARALELLERVEIPDAKRRLDAYPHQLSGGMNQRVMIAIAIACGPRLLIADEPTTALDVTIQAQVMALLARLRREQGMALVLITHDLALMGEMAEGVPHTIAVMYAGQVVERGTSDALFDRPRHPYTAALLAALPEANRGARRLAALPGVVPGRFDRPQGCLFAPRCPRAQARCVAERPAFERGLRCFFPIRADEGPRMLEPVLRAENLVRHYAVRRGFLRAPAVVKALDGVGFQLQAGRTLAIVGESGCGKSTLARQLVLIEPPTAGRLLIDGRDAAKADAPARRALRRRVQMVFQNPYASLNPRKSIEATLAEPLVINEARLTRAERRDRIAAMISKVGLRPEHLSRYPHMFSGGQRQRIAIARAMMLGPGIVVADEPTSALDVSIQAQILNLFMDLQDAEGTAFVFVSHNLAVVEHVAHEVAVMFLGRIVEQGPKAELLRAPAHPYTRALLSAAPALKAAERRERIVLKGEMPSPLAPPPGCAFHTRCPMAVERCRVEVPALVERQGRRVACHLVNEGAER